MGGGYLGSIIYIPSFLLKQQQPNFENGFADK